MSKHVKTPGQGAEYIGLRIACLRKARNCSQDALAKHLNVTRGAIAQWETGRAAPNISRIETMADFLETTPEWIAFGAGVIPLGMTSHDLAQAASHSGALSKAA